jgi:peptidoglycan/xylan/chitin deacetylase (PgdA/CDA1 family)
MMDLKMKIYFDRVLTEGQKRLGLGRHGFYSPTPYSRKDLVVRLVYMMCALVWAILTGFGRFRRDGIVVLCYHGVSARQRERFAWQMSKIRFRVVNSSRKLPGRGYRVSVTFDDAFANLLENALPALERYQVPAAIFAVVDNLGCTPCWEMPAGHPGSAEMTMTAEQLAVISRNPLICIGSHTLSHPDLAKIPPDQLKAELIDSKIQLKQLLGSQIEDLALPFGSYNQEVLRMAREAGYKRIYTIDPKPVNLTSEGPVMGRFSISPDMWKIEFILTCAGAYTWLYYWRRFVCFVRQCIPGIASEKSNDAKNPTDRS